MIMVLGFRPEMARRHKRKVQIKRVQQIKKKTG